MIDWGIFETHYNIYGGLFLQKKIFANKFFTYVKLFVSFFLTCMFYLITQVRKACHKKKVLNLWIFRQMEVWIVFRSLASCLNYKNNCDLTKVNKNEQVGSITICLKSAKLISILNCSKWTKWPVWKSIYLES